MSVVIIDYGSSNLRSAAKAFERGVAEGGLSTSVEVSADPDHVRKDTTFSPHHVDQTYKNNPPPLRLGSNSRLPQPLAHGCPCVYHIRTLHSVGNR
jgi:hypothetical protein